MEGKRRKGRKVEEKEARGQEGEELRVAKEGEEDGGEGNKRKGGGGIERGTKQEEDGGEGNKRKGGGGMEGERRKEGAKRKRNARNTLLHWPLPPWHSYLR